MKRTTRRKRGCAARHFECRETATAIATGRAEALMRATSRLSTRNLVPVIRDTMVIVERTDDLNQRLLAGGYRGKPRVVRGGGAPTREQPIFIKSHRVPAEIMDAKHPNLPPRPETWKPEVPPGATGWIDYGHAYPGGPLIERPRSDRDPVGEREA